MLNRCTACAISALSVGCMIVLICRVSLVDSLEEGTRGDGRGCDGIYVATILVDLEVALGNALADDVSLAVFLKPRGSLGAKSWRLSVLQYGITGDGAIIGKKAVKPLAVSKDGGEVDAITASTITSRAFLKAVNQAYAAYMQQSADAHTGATKIKKG